jgi:hypothetical protein
MIAVAPGLGKERSLFFRFFDALSRGQVSKARLQQDGRVFENDGKRRGTFPTQPESLEPPTGTGLSQ